MKPSRRRWWLAVERGTATDAPHFQALDAHLRALGPDGDTLAGCAQAVGIDARKTGLMLANLRHAGRVQTVPNSFPQIRFRAMPNLPLCDCGRNLGIHPRGYTGRYESCRAR